MFTRFVVRSASSAFNASRSMMTVKSSFSTMSGKVYYSTNNNNKGGNVKATTTPPPQQQQVQAKKEVVAEDEVDFENNDDIYDMEEEFTEEELKELNESRELGKRDYNQVINLLMESTDKSTLINPRYEIKPTIVITTPSGQIAHALFSTATQARSLRIVNEDVDLVLESFEGIPSFRSLVEGEITNDEKITLIELFINAVGLSPITEFFLYQMSNDLKFNLIVPALKDFKRLAASLSAEMTIRLTVAHEYNEAEKKQLETQVSSYFAADAQIKYLYTVDPAIKGGYKIESPFLNHNATLLAAEQKVSGEEKTLMSEFYNELRGAVNNNNPVWETKAFEDKYLKFDAKAYEAKLEAEK